MLMVLNSAIGQIESNSNEKRKGSLSHQHSSINAITNRIDPNIRCIFQDSKGNYWFGTNGAGVFRYNTKTLTQFTTKDGLTDNQVLRIQEDDLGNIWFGTGVFGVCKFDGLKFTTHTYSLRASNITDFNYKKNDLWFNAGDGVFNLSKTELTYLPFVQLNSLQKTSGPYSLSRFSVYSILKDKNGNVWFGTQAEGVGKYDGKTLTWYREKGLAGPAVLGLFEDSKGRIWFGNNGAGLFLYEGKTLTNFTQEKGLNNADFTASGKPGIGTLARVYSINEDNKGNIWVGTVDAGVWKYDGSKLTNYTTKDGLASNAINTIYKDRNGELWFGSDSNGICKFNVTTFEPFNIE